MMKMKSSISVFVLWMLTCCGCHSREKQATNGLRFSLVDKGVSDIGFNNRLTENDSVNFLVDQYIYIGAGVGVGDFNNDGLPDLFFAGGQVSSKLYINKGNFHFEDITQQAGLETSAWCTGVTVVDINNDGWPDIYVCVSHAKDPSKRKNLLFINQGNGKDGQPSFKEQAAEYGLADEGFSTQSAFLDYDGDGRMDMYLMNHNVIQNQPNNIVAQQAPGSASAADRLYRNEGIPPGMNHPVFKDVTQQAGIHDEAYGLGLSVGDLNNDGWPDIYVANDFIGNDLLWLNNKNGTFTNVIAKSMHHQSYNSMGVDAADINNDGWPDIAVLDMLPETNYRKKTMFAGSNPERYDMEQRQGGYQPEFTRNMLQLHNGVRHAGDTALPFFSEIGQLAGISQTDWSWSVLMADFDNDGWKDIHITNGLAKDLTNNDFLLYRDEHGSAGGGFGSGGGSGGGGSPGSAATGPSAGTTERDRALRKDLDAYGSVKVNNYLYHNNGNLGFSDITDSAGLDIPSVSHGAVYVDLDNDGDLDIVVNNMNQEAFVWRNELRSSVKDSIHNFLTFLLKGDSLNREGLGAKLSLYADGKIQYLEQDPVRGYMSSVDYRPHFGIGNALLADSLRITWPGGKVQVLRNIAANQFITLYQKDAVMPLALIPGSLPTGGIIAAQKNFTDISAELHSSFRHNETYYFDFGHQRLLPQKYSQLGPPLATGDVNGDGLTDFFVGGASRQSGQLFIQDAKGGFMAHDLVTGQKTSEDIGVVFFDADGDGDLDLLVSEGSLEFDAGSNYDQPRLYLNDGHGNFTWDKEAIPAAVNGIFTTIAIGDFNADGQPDIFIGGRMLPDQYPLSPRSYLLENRHGKFVDVTHRVCPALEQAGMITAAVWADLDNDRRPDLVICGEWMPVRFFSNTGGRLEEVTGATGLTHMNGFWRSIKAVDLDGDGDIDLVVGNLGMNNKYHVSAERPLKLYAKDLDNNGSLDLIPAYYIKDSKGEYQLFPGLDRTQLAEEVPGIKKIYLLNKDFAQVTMQELLDKINEKDYIEKTCETTESVWLENLGHGQFRSHPLPVEAQFAPVNAIVARDLDGDGVIDLLLAGNEYQTDIATGRYDASYGLFLKGRGKGAFSPVGPMKSGFIIEGDVKSMQTLGNRKGEQMILAAVNNDSVRCFRVNKVLE